MSLERVNRILHIMDRYEDDAYFDEQSFAEQLRRWFVVHFKTKDPRLHRFLGY